MRNNQTLIDDMLALGGSVLGNFLEARHELKAQARQKADRLARRLDLVSREEFDAAFAMLSKARAMQEELAERLARIEKHVKLAGSNKPEHSGSVRLRSVKKARRAPKRR